MGFDAEKSIIMANRLKQLREGKGLSHEKLSRALYDQYEVKISPDSLMNYEVSDPGHTKAYKNQGMRVEYLRCLADFYGVPTDYILGITDIRSPDVTIHGIISRTGLSENNVLMLCAAQSIINATGGDTAAESEHALQDQFLDNFGFLKDVCPRHAGFNFNLLVNELISAALADQGLLVDYGTLLDARIAAPIMPFDFDSQNFMEQMGKGLIPIPAGEYVRYISNEIGKSIADYLAKGESDGND